MTAVALDLQKVLLTRLTDIITRKYGKMPVSLHIIDHPVMTGWLVRVGVTGQTREVHFTRQQIAAYNDILQRDALEEEILFAVFLLLDENEDDE